MQGDSMKRSTETARVSIHGSSQSVTDAPSSVQNEPAGHWMPGIYDRVTITDAGQGTPDELAGWADLAAASLADWAAENPF